MTSFPMRKAVSAILGSFITVKMPSSSDKISFTAAELSVTSMYFLSLSSSGAFKSSCHFLLSSQLKDRLHRAN